MSADITGKVAQDKRKWLQISFYPKVHDTKKKQTVCAKQITNF